MTISQKYIKQSKSFKEFFFYLFKSLYERFIKLRLWLRIYIIILLVIFGLIAPGRLGFYGDKIYQITQIILHFHIPIIDDIVCIPLEIKFNIDDIMGSRELKLGDVCKSGDTITISFQAGLDCYFMIVCVDAKKFQLIFPAIGEADCLKGGEAYSLNPFKLDDTLGSEFYYCIASDKPFSFKKDIEKHLLKVFPDGHTKGSASVQYELILPKGFTSKNFYFEHTN